MIRTKDKVFGEANDPNTVLAPNTLNQDVLVVGNNNKAVRFAGNYNIMPGKVFITKDGDLTSIDYSNKPNKVIGTDETGKIVLIDRSEL